MTTSNTPTSPSDDQAKITRLTGEIDVLVERLEIGWGLYEKSTNPAQRQRYFDKWTPLLHEYEEKCQLRRDLGYAEPLPD